MTALAPYLSAFLLEHLPRERKASPHTRPASPSATRTTCAVKAREVEHEVVKTSRAC
jgi:hypothetical protein